ncbi:MAG: nicotinate (nicotinamide) nucleotide adenylyltransferase [Acidobacteria bacterium]|nr:nicotinate (nicotinamide) nucleotide adenylyltransferase [Acidobacteriota bacterium]MXW38833.1 nicotinate (nicotinamide) nucleotide adenylyltransferase [Acidobacteriota bacterium]MYA47522.1 nicotinate (nicotinamide) nucleotide adenylyltransferase [Acidobacteriota bacterium]MYI38005.1 nicotinate (nicotinamide) nucleotide adenylyltransferase [Acidobacteriota bacterium]
MTAGAVRRPGVVAVFGGTFDPPHWGHVRAAEAVRDRMGVEAVWLVPARIPPHRAAPRLSAEERLGLAEEAVAGRERLFASPIELEREGPSFTIDTLDGLAAGRDRPAGGAAVVFVVGSDAFQEIHTWSRYEQLLDRHPVLVHRRAGCAIAEAVTVLPRRFRARVTDDLSAPLIPPRILTLDIDLPDPKSYRIRELLKQQTPVYRLVPPRVAARIAERGFYR